MSGFRIVGVNLSQMQIRIGQLVVAEALSKEMCGYCEQQCAVKNIAYRHTAAANLMHAGLL